MTGCQSSVFSRFRASGAAFGAVALMALNLAVAAPAMAQINAEELFRAVVGVEADVPAEARTAATLGTHRAGSGVVISDDGLILTIGYLIMEAGFVDVVVADDRKVPAEVVAYDHTSGFGLIRAVGDLDITPVKLGDSSDLPEQSQVLVTTRNGARGAQGAEVVSRRVFTGSWEYLIEDAIFTSPPHRGFGGAALIGPDGSLLGIGSLFVGNAAGANRRSPGNMFVPIDLVKPILDDLIATGRRGEAARPWLGVYPQTASGRVVFTRIAEDSPAAASGLETGDLVVSVNGTSVATLEDFYRAVWSAGDAGATVPMTVLRSSGGGVQEFAVPSIDRNDWLRLNPSF